jgi:DNA-binding NarL/FixJ family response regulator
MTDQLRVLIVDDHPVFRDGLRSTLSVAPEMTLVGEAGTGKEAVDMAIRLRPELVVMDIQMPGMNGIEATRRIVDASPDTNVLVVTMFEDDALVFAAMRAGAKGYVLKGVRSAELLRAMRAVGSGEAVFSPTIATRLTEYFGAIRTAAVPQQLFPELSDREHEILELIAQGYKNAEIAQRRSRPKTDAKVAAPACAVRRCYAGF